MLRAISPAVFVVLACSCAPRTAPGIARAKNSVGASVGVVDTVVKVRPGDHPALSSSAAIHAAKNEYESFQAVVMGGASGLTNVSAIAPALVGPGGATIPAANVRLYREGLMNITTPSSIEGAVGYWPDPLIPDVDDVYNEKRNAFPFSVPAGENRVILVDVLVPADAPAGIYSGALAVTSAELGTVEVPVTLEVWSFSLPSTASLHSFFDMGWDDACVAHFGSYEACGSDAGVIKMKLLYGRFLLNRRISTDVIYYGPPPSGNDYDWQNGFDNYYGPLLDGTDPGVRLPGAKLTSAVYQWKADPAHYLAWANHFKARGWFDRTFDYTCDEPPATCAWSEINARAALIHGAVPDFRTLVTTSINNAVANGVVQSIDIIAPTINTMDDKAESGPPYAGNQRPQYDAFLAGDPNNRLWWYQGCTSHGCNEIGGEYFTGWASMMIDVSGVQNRAMEWLSFSYAVDTELYYDITYSLGNAWNSVYAFGGNGDGDLVYPGKPSLIGGTSDIPVGSYRLTMVREGMEDYEYLKLVSDLGDPKFAHDTATALFASTHDCAQPPEALMAARLALARRIVELSGGAPPPPTLTYDALSAAQPVALDGTTASFAGANVVALSGASAGSRATAQVRILWDATNLYVGYSVNDSVLHVNEGGRDGEVWDGDGVELFLDTKGDRSARQDSNDYHLIINIDGDLLDERGTGSGWDRSWSSNAAYKVVPTSSGYDVSIQLPWAAMGVTAAAAQTMGLDVAVNDSWSAGQDAPFDWAQVIPFAQPAKWGTLVLDGKVDEAYGAHQPPAAVSIDGNLQEFSRAASIPLSGVKAGAMATADARVMWDANNLYLGIAVTDPVVRVNQGGRDGEVWNGDGVELFLDTKGDRVTPVDGDDYHVIINAVGDLLDERGNGTGWDRSWSSQAVYKVVPTPVGYAVEAQIPWASLGVTANSGLAMGIDIGINDSQRAGQDTPFDWAGLLPFAQPSRWNTLVLDGP